MMKLSLFALIAAFFALAVPAVADVGEAAFDPRRAAFSVSINGVDTIYDVSFATVMPGGQVHLLPATDAGMLRLEANAGVLEESGAVFRWGAPFEPGHYPLRLVRDTDGAAMLINVLVLRPAWQMEGTRLNGYLIGAYPAKPKNGNPLYAKPEGFIEVTPELADLPVSPHFTLGQFLCKQESDWPKYMLLRPQLVAKLELLLAEINAAGIRTDGFHVMSAYRTPAYNKAIGNNTTYSRHLWGGAADIFIDADGDGRMDDLNGDGRSDRRDAAVLYDLVDTVSGRRPFLSLAGGLGEYDGNHVRGPFVHVDVRGANTRWGRSARAGAAP